MSSNNGHWLVDRTNSNAYGTTSCPSVCLSCVTYVLVRVSQWEWLAYCRCLTSGVEPTWWLWFSVIFRRLHIVTFWIGQSHFIFSIKAYFV